MLSNHAYSVLKEQILQRSSVAQLVEQSAVNRSVGGSSPSRGAIWMDVRAAEGARLEIV